MNQATFVKPYQEKVFQHKNSYCVYDATCIDNFSEQIFDSHFWQSENLVTATAQGRGVTWFVNYQDQHWVLRHYYRGGMIGKLIKDSYWFNGINATRAAREFNLLKKLHELALPAPKPIAYRVIKKGCTYRADLITARIAQANDLVAILTKRSLSSELWQRIGKTIRRFHNQGIYHHDLNAHNILIDQQEQVWLIDFDQGEQRVVASQWQQANMNRLLRSFNKEQQKLSSFFWQNSDWESLCAGYTSED